MKLPQLSKVTLVLFAIIIFIFLLMKFLSVDFVEHDRYNGDLRQINQVDATLNKDIFELRYGTLAHYDTLVAKVNVLEVIQTDLQIIPNFISNSGKSQLNQLLKTYKNLQEQKEELIEKFKSDNAILKNSLYYFPTLTTKIAQDVAVFDSDLSFDLNNLLRDVLVYNLTSSEDLAPQIKQQLTTLTQKNQRYQGSDLSLDIELIIAHVNIILENKPAVDNLIETLVSLPTAQRGEELFRIYNYQYEKALNMVGIYRVLLSIFSITLISVISSYIILKLRNAAAEVNAAKERLQQALEATQQAEEKYRSIFENSTDGIFQTTLKGEFLSANPRLAQIFGYDSPAELMKVVTDISRQIYVNPERRAEFMMMMQRYGSVSQFDSQAYRADGSIIWISENARSALDPTGKFLYYEGTVEDITIRKQMTAALKESETRLRKHQAALMELTMCQPLYSGDWSAAFRAITETATTTLGLERASIWLYNEDHSTLRCVDLYELTPNRHSAGLLLQATDYPGYFQALETDRTISAHDAHLDPRTCEFSQSYLTPLGIASMLDVPIRLRGQTAGVICLEHIGPMRRWALEEQNFGSYLAYMASLAMEARDRKLAQEALRLEQENAERLLLNILPKPIAERLKKESGSIADHFEEVTVLFADIVGFTQLSTSVPPAELVRRLNKIFSCFDLLADRHDLEKIKTIGDAYMVVGGLPTPRFDHAEAIAEMALEMQQEVARFSAENDHSVSIRIGINTGPVVAGVIGLKKFIYDLWGDTVNTASRMESHGIPGAIQVTEATYVRLQHKYHFEQRGFIEVKGKGEMMAYLLKGKSSG
jgi:PAS domain S-box-containing protein